ncbi:MAG TPA: nucleotidyl transferase AbiEii/AbiGii toxin family protein [Candidatus Mediterraneibacter merdigallinarum]|nr:nucleotidyl transferase AbiEii/AbiGii toxin family protein [Candidatus Mediterraneibacter merdigallinarum]
MTPKEIQFSYPFLFDERRVMVKAYTQETILAEKYETIIRRNVGNTRARDFYDLHLLYRLYRENADWNLLKQAVLATAKKEIPCPFCRTRNGFCWHWKNQPSCGIYGKGIRHKIYMQERLHILLSWKP